MLLTVLREYKEKATPGTMYALGDRFCYSLEPEKGKCIAEGIYPIHLTYSPRFKRIMPLIIGTAGYSGVRIHWGNFRKDTQACQLVGYDKGVDAVGTDAVYRSKICFEELLRWLIEANKSQELLLEIKS